MLITNSDDMAGISFEGNVEQVAATLMHYAETYEHIGRVVTLASLFSPNNIQNVLDKSEKLIDGYLEELKKNRPEDSK